MKPQTQRILAIIGLVLMFVCIVLMLVGLFAGAAKALLLNISLYCFLGAVTILLIVSYRRKQPEKTEDKKD